MSVEPVFHHGDRQAEGEGVTDAGEREELPEEVLSLSERRRGLVAFGPVEEVVYQFTGRTAASGASGSGRSAMRR